MKVGFYNVYWGSPKPERTVHLVLADMMIRSVRRTMPDVEIVQLTDEQSPQVWGVDSVRRLPRMPRAVQCVTHYSHCEGNWLLVDTDIIVQRDVRDVFRYEFDVAVADREGCMVDGEEDTDLMKNMPFNIGVIFSRSPAFWKAVLEKLSAMPEQKQEWMGNQNAACAVMAEHRFHVKVLPGLVFNRPPFNSDDRCQEASIIHFKGPMRKRWMLDRFEDEFMVA